jgi:hypothetical protein
VAKQKWSWGRFLGLDLYEWSAAIAGSALIVAIA